MPIFYYFPASVGTDLASRYIRRSLVAHHQVAVLVRAAGSCPPGVGVSTLNTAGAGRNPHSLPIWMNAGPGRFWGRRIGLPLGSTSPLGSGINVIPSALLSFWSVAGCRSERSKRL